MSESPVYYRVIVSLYRPNEAAIIEMQDFDEADYDHRRYITQRKFDTRDEALQFCQRVSNLPTVPAHIKALLESLVGIDYNVDPYIYKSTCEV